MVNYARVYHFHWKWFEFFKEAYELTDTHPDKMTKYIDTYAIILGYRYSTTHWEVLDNGLSVLPSFARPIPNPLF